MLKIFWGELQFCPTLSKSLRAELQFCLSFEKFVKWKTILSQSVEKFESWITILPQCRKVCEVEYNFVSMSKICEVNYNYVPQCRKFCEVIYNFVPQCQKVWKVNYNFASVSKSLWSEVKFCLNVKNLWGEVQFCPTVPKIMRSEYNFVSQSRKFCGVPPCIPNLLVFVAFFLFKVIFCDYFDLWYFFVSTTILKHQQTWIITGVLKLLVQDAVNYLISMAISRVFRHFR